VQNAWSAPVRYAECDQQGVAFNAHYLTWADEAMTAWAGTSYDDLLARGLDTHVKASTLTWSSPARWGEVVTADVRCSKVGRTSFTLEIDLRVDTRECCALQTTYVVVDSDGLPFEVPDEMRERWEG
jgi:acyl-CoA thioester hydrolase